MKGWTWKDFWDLCNIDSLIFVLGRGWKGGHFLASLPCCWFWRSQPTTSFRHRLKTVEILSSHHKQHHRKPIKFRLLCIQSCLMTGLDERKTTLRWPSTIETNPTMTTYFTNVSRPDNETMKRCLVVQRSLHTSTIQNLILRLQISSSRSRMCGNALLGLT